MTDIEMSVLCRGEHCVHPPRETWCSDLLGQKASLQARGDSDDLYDDS